MKKLLILLIIILYSFDCYSQSRNCIWIFGDSAGIDFSNLSNPVPITSGMDGRGSCVSIADSNCNLILYAYTWTGISDWSTNVHNSNLIKILDGDSITGGGTFNELTLIPSSMDTNKYFIFSCGLDYPNNHGFYYSTIDMSQNAGNGQVIEKNVQINANPIADCVTSVKHGNGRDWWVIGKLSNDSITFYNRFYKYLIVSDSTIAYGYQDFNDARDGDLQKIVWHPDNDKFMLINPGGYMSEFGFDRCSGNISLIRNIFQGQTSNYSRLFWEGAYAPNGNIFYVTTNFWTTVDTSYLLQIDLQSANIPASIDTLDWNLNNIGPGAVRLAPDSKIYVSRPYLWGFPWYPYPDSVRNSVNENLSVINDPDSLGAACNYQPYSFYLGGKRTYFGLPNNPNYSLGALIGSSCDSLTVAVNLPTAQHGIFIHPNPASDVLYINSDEDLKSYTIEILNCSGIHIREETYRKSIDVSDLENGIYILKLSKNPSIFIKKFIVLR
jgi:hypothetical protein